MAARKRTKSPFSVRPVSRETKFSRIRKLNCFEGVKERLLAGWPPSEVARYVQEDNEEYTDVKRETLSRVLKEFRSSIAPVEAIEAIPPPDIVQQRTGPYLQQLVNKVRTGIDELSELENLYRIQMDRIGMGLNGETSGSTPKLTTTMTQEIRVAKELLESSARLKMDLGVKKRHLGALEVESDFIGDVDAKFGNKAVQKVLSDPKSRSKVVHLAEKIMSMVPKQLEAGEDEVEVETPPKPKTA